MDSLTVISFIAFTAMVGITTYFKTHNDKMNSKDGYFLGGRSLTGGIIAGSLLLTNLNAANFVGMSAQAYSSNMSVMGWEVASGITLVIVALFLVPRYLKGGITTIPDFLEERFDAGVKKFVTYLFLFGYVVNVLPPTLYSGAIALGQIFDVSGALGVSHTTGVWITVWAIGIIGSIYAIFGGLKAVAVSDTINGIGLVIGGLLVPYFGIKLLGNGSLNLGVTKILTENTEKLNAVGSSTDPVPFATLFTGMLLVNLYYWGTDQAIIQRALGAKNLEQGQKGVMLAGFLKVLTPFIVVVPGIIAFHFYGGGFEKPDLLYPRLVNDVMPRPLVGFFSAVMFGAVLSTFNSVLNSATTLFALNVYKPIFGKNKSDEQIVGEGKKFGIILALASMFIAPFIMYAPHGLFQYLQVVNGFFNVPIFTIIFIGYVTKRVPAIAAKIALTIFVSTYALLQLVIKPDIHFLHQLAILFVVCSVIMLIIGKIKPRAEPFVLKNKKLVDIEPWAYRYEATVIVLFVMVSMYLVFSGIGVSTGSYTLLIMSIGALFLLSIAALIMVRKRKKMALAVEEI